MSQWNLGLQQFIEFAHAQLWGPWMLFLIMGTGALLHIVLKGKLFWWLFGSFKLLTQSHHANGQGQITPFRALMTTLSATIGTGNIAGVATAIAAGGPGALFWMWVAGVIGMATKFAEAVLAVRFRQVDQRGEYLGGPMYYIRLGLGASWAPLASAYALFAAITAFGLGNMVQANAVAEILGETLQMPKLWCGGLLALIIGGVVLGGLNRIAKLASRIVPLMACLYVGASLAFLIYHWQKLPDIFHLILSHAFAPSAAAGGFAGASISMAMRLGVARGIFANEAGLGSGAISHATARTNSSVEQGLIAMWGTVIDTLIICNMSGLVILTSEQWQTGLSGATLTARAFSTTFEWGGALVAISLILFSFTTILGWGFYGERCFQYLFGARVLTYYRIAWVLAIPIGATVNLSLIWLVSDVMNALMALPNLIALIMLAPVLIAISQEYKD